MKNLREGQTANISQNITKRFRYRITRPFRNHPLDVTRYVVSVDAEFEGRTLKDSFISPNLKTYGEAKAYIRDHATKNQ